MHTKYIWLCVYYAIRSLKKICTQFFKLKLVLWQFWPTSQTIQVFSTNSDLKFFVHVPLCFDFVVIVVIGCCASLSNPYKQPTVISRAKSNLQWTFTDGGYVTWISMFKSWQNNRKFIWTIAKSECDLTVGGVVAISETRHKAILQCLGLHTGNHRATARLDQLH